MDESPTMPIALHRSNSWSDRILSASEFSPIEWFALGMGSLGFSVEVLASVFRDSGFSVAVRSDLGAILATINAVSVLAVVVHHILRKERVDSSFSSPPPQMPDSSEAECDKMNRVRRRREEG